MFDAQPPRITPITSIPSIARTKTSATSSSRKTHDAANGSAMNAHNAGTNARYGASRNRSRSAPAGMRSSLPISLMPSASDCAQPCHRPVRIGPRRLWIRPETFRSHQMANIASSDTKPTTPARMITSRTIPNCSGHSSQLTTGSDSGPGRACRICAVVITPSSPDGAIPVTSRTAIE